MPRTNKIAGLPYKARVEEWERIRSRPPQAPIDGPFWIVINLNIESAAGYGRPKNFYRHTSATLAFAEAERLRGLNEGGAFGVFYCCGICRSAPPDPLAGAIS